MIHVFDIIIKLIVSIFIVIIGLSACIISLILWDHKFIDIADEIMLSVWRKKE